MTSPSSATHLENRRASIGVAAAIVVIAALLWLPTGWNSPPNWADWYFHARLDVGDTQLFSSAFPTRPLTPLPWAIGYTLFPDHDFGVNLVLWALIVIKSAFVYVLVRVLLPNARQAAALIALMALLYPADTGMLYMESLNVHLSLVLSLAAVYGLARVRRRWKLAVAVTSLIALGSALLVYEAGLPLLILGPLLVAFVVPVRAPKQRRFYGMTALWMILLGLAIAFIVISTLSGSGGYQGGLLDLSTPLIRPVLAFLFVYSEHFWRGFRDSLQSLSDAPVSVDVLLACGTAVVTLLTLRIQPPLEAPSAIRWSRVVQIGLVGTLLGYAIYIPTTMIVTPMRTFFYSSVCAAIVVIAGLYALAPRPLWQRLIIGEAVLIGAALMRVPLYGLDTILGAAVLIWGILLLLPARFFVPISASVLIGVSTLTLLTQHRFYDESGERQHAALRTIVEQAPAFSPGTVVVLINQAGIAPPDVSPIQFDHPDPFGYSYLVDSSLKVIYRTPQITGRNCSRTDGVGENTCRFDDDGLTVITAALAWDTFPPTETIAYDQLVAFGLPPDGSLILLDDLHALTPLDTTAYQPRARIVADAPRPRRAFTMLGLPIE